MPQLALGEGRCGHHVETEGAPLQMGVGPSFVRHWNFGEGQRSDQRISVDEDYVVARDTDSGSGH